MSKYTRNAGTLWTSSQITQLKELAKQNTPTRVIGLKLGRTATAIQQKATEERISLKPINKSPYGTVGTKKNK